jgi:hypothetical protein
MEQPKNVSSTQRGKLVFIACGFLGILWLFFEDNNLNWLKLLSLSFSGLLIIYSIRLPSRPAWFHYLLLGVVFGFLVTLTALLMMVLKMGLHTHPLPEYSLEQFKEIVYLTPIWAFSAILIMTGAQLWKQAG